MGMGRASEAWEKRLTLKVGDALAVIRAKLIALKIVLVLLHFLSRPFGRRL